VLASLRSGGLFGETTAASASGAWGEPQLAFGEQAAEGKLASSLYAAHSVAARIVPGKRYLNVRIRGGRAFVDCLPASTPDAVAEAHTQAQHVLTLSMEFRGNRCVASPVPAVVEPSFNENFLFPLQDEESPSEIEGMAPLEKLAEMNIPLHLVVVRESSLGTSTLMSSAWIEWRKVLVHGRLSLNVELKGNDELQLPVGLLEMDLEILPLKMPPNPKELPVFVEYSSLMRQLKRDQELTSGIEARFHAYAKAWWNDYTMIRPLHQNRLIQLFGKSERGGRMRSVCTFLSPLRADRCLDSPLHAARFVRLIPYVKDTTVGGSRTEIWHSPHTILTRRSGDVEDHALMLCSLLLGFGLDAYVAVGIARDKGAHVWVITRGDAPTSGEGHTIVCWESLTGQRFELDTSPAARAVAAAGLSDVLDSSPSTTASSSSFPFLRIHCLFNHHSFYANVQLHDSLPLVDWRLDNPAAWKALNERAIEVLPRTNPIYLRHPTIDARKTERELERSLREMIDQYRREYANLSTSWSSDLSYVLSPALSSYESERVTGICFGQSEFEQSIKRTVPYQCVFKAVPFQFTSLHPHLLFASMIQSRALQDLLASDGQELRLGIRCKVIVYPEDFCAVWIMVASIKRADDLLIHAHSTMHG